MDEILLARVQMAMSLGFHIIFASVGIAMPVLMVAAEIWGLVRRDPELIGLAKRWAKGTAVLFAVGAVSGTVLSFELGLLFPGFMRLAGAIIGVPFSLEGFAFFTEAIFLGLYLYGWDRLPPRVHAATGVMVAVSGLLSAVFVTFVNAWMNAPEGAVLEGGRIVDVDPLAALKTAYALHEIPHMALASYVATAGAVAGIHAYALLRDPRSTLHAKALTIALALAIPCALLQPPIGHFAGQQVARYQPLKLAALEQHHQTRARAPLKLGPFEIPGGLSWMAFGDPDAVVKGLDAFPPADRPHPIIRPAFLAMVGLGTIMALHAAVAVFLLLRRRAWAASRPFLAFTLLCAPMGYVALEAGWIVTEVGRQPWVVYGLLKTSASATPVHGLGARLWVFAVIYLILGITVAMVMTRHVRSTLKPAATP